LATRRLPLLSVVFDFDGTLAKLNIDFSLMRQQVLDLIAGYRIPLPPNGLRDLFVLEMITAGAALVSQYQPGKEAEFIERAHALITAIEIKAAQKGALFNGTRELMTALQGEGVKTGVITRNCLAAVQTLFPDIYQYTQVVITREQTPHVKPHPGHLMTALDRLNVAAGQAAMVGDHPMDIKTGKDAGAFTIGVLTGYSGREALEQAGADMILDAATDIPAILA
jgi:phosphoglycolate phosphatase